MHQQPILATDIILYCSNYLPVYILGCFCVFKEKGYIFSSLNSWHLPQVLANLMVLNKVIPVLGG